MGNGSPKRLPGVTVGRPPKILQETVRKRLIGALATGNYASIACRYAGVSYDSFADWLREGRIAREKEDAGGSLSDREEFFLLFLRDVEDAEARAEIQVVGNLMVQSRNSPQAALGFLSVRFPERWRQKTAVEVSGPDGGPIALSPVLAQIPDDALEERIRSLEAEISDPPKPKVLKGGKR